MTDLRQAAQQALEALESLQGGCTDHDDGTVEAITVWCPEVIDALRTALEQQAEPPPEWPLIKNILAVFGLDAIAFVAEWKAAQQQAAPPQRKELSEIQILDMMPSGIPAEYDGELMEFARAIEAKLKERNGY